MGVGVVVSERHGLVNVAVVAAGIAPPLVHLIKLRASQLNDCAFCVKMHAKEARDDGETERACLQEGMGFHFCVVPFGFVRPASPMGGSGRSRFTRLNASFVQKVRLRYFLQFDGGID